MSCRGAYDPLRLQRWQTTRKNALEIPFIVLHLW